MSEPNIVTLMYTAPIRVRVNLDTGLVEHVTVLDEAVEVSYRSADAQTVADAERAWELAETMEWPAWEVGT